jgi:hypothetical protein
MSRKGTLYWLWEQFLPLPYALYVNKAYRSKASAGVAETVPDGEWAFLEAAALLERSEQRLESIEAKGPGLATVSAIVAGAAVLTISLVWTQSPAGAQAILVGSAVYSAMSLWAPIMLVGPLARATVTSATLADASNADDPHRFLAAKKFDAAAENDRTTLVLANHQAASRNDARNALILFLAWAVLAWIGVVDP